MRSKDYPYGLPNLSDKDQAKVALGNLLLERTIVVVKRCIDLDIYVSVENPRLSRLWWCPNMLDAIAHNGVKVCLDFCAYGTMWKNLQYLLSGILMHLIVLVAFVMVNMLTVRMFVVTRVSHTVFCRDLPRGALGGLR